MRRTWWTFAILATAALLLSATAWPAQSYPAAGLILKVDHPHHTLIVSCQSIPGYMDAMVMSFSVKEAKLMEPLEPGMMIDFTLVVTRDSSYIEGIRVRSMQSVDNESLQAQRLKILQGALPSAAAQADPVTLGQAVPNFRLIDQSRKPVSLAQFGGKVVAINFVYTRCALPNYCFRLANNFGRLQKRFSRQMGRDLVLLTVSFDPVHDQPEVLAKYSEIWKADPATWHFLTGSLAEVQRVCSLFGVDAWQDEGLLTHSLHTAVIDRAGRLAANIEGNEFTPEQLGDLVESVMKRE